jgi:hypothetical protein
MSFSRSRMPVLILATLFAASACHGSAGLPPGAPQAGGAPAALGAANSALVSADTTSILKKLTKDVVIGSTVDSGNGDKGPRAISIVPNNNGVLKKGQLLVCNFEDKGGTVGNGTTLELLDPTAGSKAKRFYQSSEIEGCDGDAISPGDAVFPAGLMSHEVVELAVPYGKTKYKLTKKYGSPIESPLNDSIELQTHSYAADYVFVGDSKTGSMDIFSANDYGHPLLQGVTGFAVNSKAPGHRLGPSGLQYVGKGDTVYIVDGASDTIVAVTSIAKLLEKDEIVVKPGGKTFDCKHKVDTCAHLVLAGKPLDGPLASALLPNGNLIVANTKGTANMLIELTPAGKILDTKVVDKGTGQGIYGLAAGGSSDSNTVLFYTDTNDNSVHELKR